jgi:hypothetical protein
MLPQKNSSNFSDIHYAPVVRFSLNSTELPPALDCGYITNMEFDTTYNLAGECRSQIKTFRSYLRKNKIDNAGTLRNAGA